MANSVTVVIPTLNEEARIGPVVDAAFASGAGEVIVADGGSSDRTVALAAAGGARVVEGERRRSRQLNQGAAAATGMSLIFLHADTLLPPNGCAAVSRALEDGAHFGGFRIAFAEPHTRLRIAAAMINARTRWTHCPWGDQAQFISRGDFLSSGGFRDISIMEDYEFAVRMKRFGRSVLLDQRVTTSGRRFLERGLLGTSWLNWRIILAWRAGADPEELARRYWRQ